jgi:hypothetical protein
MEEGRERERERARKRACASPKELRRFVLLPSQAVARLGTGCQGEGKEGFWIEREGGRFTNYKQIGKL